jgi:predicted nucleotidyltransferase
VRFLVDRKAEIRCPKLDFPAGNEDGEARGDPPARPRGRSPDLAKPLSGYFLERMDRQEILARLRENEGALRARGVSHAALFGSRARGDNRPDSDIDIMIEVDPAARIGVYEYVALKNYIAELFDGPVDVVSRDGLKPYVRPAATAGAVYAF